MLVLINAVYSKSTKKNSDKKYNIWKKIILTLGVEDTKVLLSEYSIDTSDIYKYEDLINSVNNNLPIKFLSHKDLFELSNNKLIFIGALEGNKATDTKKKKPSDKAKSSNKKSTSSSKKTQAKENKSKSSTAKNASSKTNNADETDEETDAEEEDTAKEEDENVLPLRQDEILELLDSLQQDQEMLAYAADTIIAIDKEDRKGYKHIILYGHIKLEFQGKKLNTDLVLIKLRKNKVIEALGVGRAIFNTGSQTITGSKLYYYPETQKALIYQPATFNRPWFVIGKLGKRMDEGKIIVEGGLITTCILEYPHYHFLVDKVWVYEGDKVFATNMQMIVGNSSIFYFPFMFRTEYATGILTAFAAERGLGWYVNNTYYVNPSDTTFLKLMGDYYEKMGTYFGESFNFNHPYGSIKFDSGIAFDRAIKFVGGRRRFSNTFDQNGDGILEESSHFRWKVDTSGNLNLFNESRTGLSVNTTFNYKNQGEPYFQQQFESYRKEVFNINDLIDVKPTEQGWVEGAAVGSGYGGQGQVLGLGLNIAWKKISVGIRGDWTWLLQKKLAIAPEGVDSNQWYYANNTSPFSTSCYKNYRQSFVYPKITISYGDNLIENIFSFVTPSLGKEAQKQSQNAFQKPWYDQHNSPYISSETLIGGVTQLPIEQRALDTPRDAGDFLQRTIQAQQQNSGIYGAANQSQQQKPKKELAITLPVQYSIGADFTETRTYDTNTDKLTKDGFAQTQRVGLTLPFNLSYDFFTLTLGNNFGVNYSIFNFKQMPDDISANIANYKYQEENTGGGYTYGSNLSINTNFWDEYEWLETKIGLSFNYNRSGKIQELAGEDPVETSPTLLTSASASSVSSRFQKVTLVNGVLVPEYTYKYESGKSENIGYSAQLDTFKSAFRLSSGESLYITKKEWNEIKHGATTKERVLRAKRSAWSASGSTQAIKYVTISDSFSYSRNLEKNKALNNSFSTGFTFGEPIDVTDDIWIRSLSTGASWNHVYTNLRSSALTYNAGVDFNITKYWGIKFSASGGNRYLYRYSKKVSKEYNEEARDFFDDLYKSVNIFDSKGREESFFKVESFNFSFTHNLHNWVLNLNVGFSPRKLRDGAYYFEPSIYFGVYLIDSPSFKGPDIQKTIRKEPSYYY